MKKTLEEIFARELARIDEASKVGPLDIEDLKKVEILTRSLKQIENPIQEEEDLGELTKEQLLALVNISKNSIDDRHENPYERTDTASDGESCKGEVGRKEKGRGKARSKPPVKDERGTHLDRKESKD